MEDKRYGLIRLSKVNKPVTTLKKNIFDSDSDDDLDANERVRRLDTSSGIRRQTQLDISRALTDDPNVFEYDAIYDEMKSKSDPKVGTEVKDKESTETKPKAKYINNLLKYSENRKKENERRIERKVQKEREQEGNEFDDKEQFVTNAYKEKLEELRAEEERDQREQAIEELLDVKKQKDLSGFYRHLLNRDMTSQESVPTDPKPDDRPVVDEEPKQTVKPIAKPKPNRQLRRRRSSSEESSAEESTQKVETNVDNNEKPIERSDKKVVKSEPKERTRHDSTGSESEARDDDMELNDENSIQRNERKEEKNIDSNEPNVKSSSEATEESHKKPKLDKRELLLKLFTKRTVDQVFSDAQMRYFERKGQYVL